MAKKRRQEKHICAYCGKPFMARKGALYCSASCRNTAAKLKKELDKIEIEPIEHKKVPVESTSVPVGSISSPIRTITPEEAKAELWAIFIATGAMWALNALFGPKKRTYRRKTHA